MASPTELVRLQRALREVLLLRAKRDRAIKQEALARKRLNSIRDRADALTNAIDEMKV